MMRGVGVLVLAVLLGFTAPARAQTQIGSKRVALVVGNGAYSHVERLANPANDARLIAATLQKLNFTLVGGGAQLDLDRAGLAQAVEGFGRAMAGADVALFYYSGHGLQVQGVNWLVPVDANPTRVQDLDFQMVDADLVLRQMDGAGTKLNLMLLDACRNNPFAMTGLRGLRSGLAEMRAPEGTLISYATQPGNVAADGGGADSPYTAALAESMQRPGLDIFRLFNQVGLAVKRGTGGSQQPWVSTSPIDGDFYFAGLSAPTASGAAQLPAPTALSNPASPPRGSAVAADQTAAREKLIAMARARPCSVLDARVVDDHVDISGYALKTPDWDDFLKQMGTSRGIRIGVPKVEFLPGFACAPVAVLGGLVRDTHDASRPRLATPENRAIAAGSPLSVMLRGAAGMAATLDLFGPGDAVQHVKVQAGDARVSIDQPAGAAAGPRLITMILSPVPLDLGSRPPSEKASAYLPDLRQVVQATAGLLADMALVDVQPAVLPRRNVATQNAPPPRCGAIIERAQLGEALSDADRGYLRAQCR